MKFLEKQVVFSRHQAGCFDFIHEIPTSDWKNVQTTWGQANAAWAMSAVAGRPNVYKYEIKPSINEYYKITGGASVQKNAFVGASGRFARLKETALEWTFLLDLAGKIN